MDFDKPFKNFDEQLELLRDKNIIIDNDHFALTCLNSHSYYSLINGFKDLFNVYTDKTKQIEVFPVNTHFRTIYSLFILDSNLNSLLFKYILGVERTFKTRLSYVISEKYGVDSNEQNIDSFLNFTKYRSTRCLDRKSELKKIIRQISVEKRSVSIDHYRKNHNHIPPWIVVNGLMFGTVINWYKILKTTDKQAVATQYFSYSNIMTLDDKLTLLPDAMSLLQKYRNNMAHGNRTFSTTLRHELPKTELLKAVNDSVLTESEFLSGIGRKDLFAVMIAIVLLIDDNNLLFYFVQELDALFNNIYKDIKLSPKGDVFETLSIPEDYKNRLYNLIAFKNPNIFK